MFATDASERWAALALGWGVDLGVKQRQSSKAMRRRLANVQEEQQKCLGRLTAQTASVDREQVMSRSASLDQEQVASRSASVDSDSMSK